MAVVVPGGDPQEGEDEHVKDVKEKTGASS